MQNANKGLAEKINSFTATNTINPPSRKEEA